MIKKLTVIIIAALAGILLCGCGFVTYEPGLSREEVAAQAALDSKRAEYTDSLNALSGEERYRDEEKLVYRRMLIESINELNEAVTEEELTAVYEYYTAAILAIRTDEQRTADEAALRERYAAMLLEVGEDKYRDAERETYRYYINSAIAELKKYTDEKALKSVYEEYKKAIDGIKTDAQLCEEEREALVAYKAAAAAEAERYFDSAKYREGEIAAAQKDRQKLLDDIEKADTPAAVDAAVRDYKVKVYGYKTDAELYAEELTELKKATITRMSTYYDPAAYRENERATLAVVREAHEGLVNAATTKEEVSELFSTYRAMVDTVKSDAALYNDERLASVEEYYSRLVSAPDTDGMTAEELQAHMQYCNAQKADMVRQATKEETTVIYVQAMEHILKPLAESGDAGSLAKLQDVYVMQLSSLVDISLYRANEQNEIRKYIDKYSAQLRKQDTYTDTASCMAEAKEKIKEVLTNDALWEKEDEEFYAYMRDKYGSGLLEMPAKMTEASDYFELAQIIDWYAFYQKDGTSFERSRFRVRLDFEHKDARWELNTVYWYCELLRGAVSIDVEAEGADYLVFELIPIDFASVSNGVKAFETRKSVCTYADAAGEPPRPADFEDFAYCSNAREVTVWNSQQLWYALEKEYVPVCVPGSSAEAVLEKCKTILREVCTDGMSVGEKIFNIYSWLGQNYSYDYHYGEMAYGSDLDKYPDENYARLRSFFPEGALFDNCAVCSGWAKTCLILFRMEGIESILVTGRPVAVVDANAINLLPFGTYGSHNYVYFKDGDMWYSCDPTSLNEAGALHGDYSLLVMAVTPVPGSRYYYSTQYNAIEDSASAVNHDVYANLEFNGKTCYVQTAEQFVDVISEFSRYVHSDEAIGDSAVISVFTGRAIADWGKGVIASIDGSLTYQCFNNASTLFEFIIYLDGE